MKNLNTLKFIAEYSKEITHCIDKIESCETYESAKDETHYTYGMVDGMVVFLSTMICKENNGFTAELDDVVEGWKHDVIQALINVADRTHQSTETMMHLFHLRDAHKN